MAVSIEHCACDCPVKYFDRYNGMSRSQVLFAPARSRNGNMTRRITAAQTTLRAACDTGATLDATAQIAGNALPRFTAGTVGRQIPASYIAEFLLWVKPPSAQLDVNPR